MYSRKWQFNLVVAITTFLFAAISNAHEAPKSEREPQQEQNYPGGDFILQSPDGQLSLQDLHGKVVLLFFGFTSCADVCPTALAVISRVFSMMSPEDLEKIRALFVSLDPGKDTFELLKQYTGYFHPNIVGVTERLENVIEISERYGVQYQRKDMPDSTLGYVIYHTPDILVVDTWGRLQQKRIPPHIKAEEIAAYIKELLPHQ